MLYYNTETKEYGKTIMALRRFYSGMSIPDDVQRLGPWIAYEETTQPIREFSEAIELEPVNGKQVWELRWITTRAEVVKIMSKTIDDACEKVAYNFNRFRAEYDQREREAIVYRDSNWNSEPGVLLSGFASKVGITNQQAALLILQQSSKLRAADVRLGDLRMSKYTLNPKEDDIPTLIAKRDAILKQIQEVGLEIK